MADQSTNIVRFPRKIRRRSKKASAAAPAAPVFAVPTSRHRKIVAFIAKKMRAQPTEDAAEDYLVSHLAVEWRRLEGFGLPEDAIDRHCRAFAVAAWKAVFLKISSSSEVVA